MKLKVIGTWCKNKIKIDGLPKLKLKPKIKIIFYSLNLELNRVQSGCKVRTDESSRGHTLAGKF